MRRTWVKSRRLKSIAKLRRRSGTPSTRTQASPSSRSELLASLAIHVEASALEHGFEVTDVAQPIHETLRLDLQSRFEEYSVKGDFFERLRFLESLIQTLESLGASQGQKTGTQTRTKVIPQLHQAEILTWTLYAKEIVQRHDCDNLERYCVLELLKPEVEKALEALDRLNMIELASRLRAERTHLQNRDLLHYTSLDALDEWEDVFEQNEGALSSNNTLSHVQSVLALNQRRYALNLLTPSLVEADRRFWELKEKLRAKQCANTLGLRFKNYQILWHEFNDGVFEIGPSGRDLEILSPRLKGENMSIAWPKDRASPSCMLGVSEQTHDFPQDDLLHCNDLVFRSLVIDSNTHMLTLPWLTLIFCRNSVKRSTLRPAKAPENVPLLPLDAFSNEADGTFSFKNKRARLTVFDEELNHPMMAMSGDRFTIEGLRVEVL